MSLAGALNWFQVGCGAAVITFALVQVGLRHKLRILTAMVYIAFFLMLVSVAFGKYYASTAPKRFEPIEATHPRTAFFAYTEAIRLNPTDSELYFRRGRTHLHLASPADAISDFTKALELSPNNPLYLESRALAFAMRLDVSAAQKDLDHARQARSHFSEINLIQGMIYDIERRDQDAIQEYTAALLGVGASNNRCSALFNRGNDYERLGMHDKAIEDYTTVYNSCSSDVREASLVNRGIAYWHSSRRDEAFADWEAALKLKPNDASVFKDRGAAFLDSGRLDLALLDFNRYIELRPYDLYGWMTRANIYTRLNNPTKANDDLQHAQNLYETRTARPYQGELHTPFGTVAIGAGIPGF